MLGDIQQQSLPLISLDKPGNLRTYQQMILWRWKCQKWHVRCAHRQRNHTAISDDCDDHGKNPKAESDTNTNFPAAEIRRFHNIWIGMATTTTSVNFDDAMMRWCSGHIPRISIGYQVHRQHKIQTDPSCLFILGCISCSCSNVSTVSLYRKSTLTRGQSSMYRFSGGELGHNRMYANPVKPAMMHQTRMQLGSPTVNLLNQNLNVEQTTKHKAGVLHDCRIRRQFPVDTSITTSRIGSALRHRQWKLKNKASASHTKTSFTWMAWIFHHRNIIWIEHNITLTIINVIKPTWKLSVVSYSLKDVAQPVRLERDRLTRHWDGLSFSKPPKFKTDTFIMMSIAHGKDLWPLEILGFYKGKHGYVRYSPKQVYMTPCKGSSRHTRGVLFRRCCWRRRMSKGWNASRQEVAPWPPSGSVVNILLSPRGCLPPLQIILLPALSGEISAEPNCRDQWAIAKREVRDTKEPVPTGW